MYHVLIYLCLYDILLSLVSLIISHMIPDILPSVLQYLFFYSDSFLYNSIGDMIYPGNLYRKKWRTNIITFSILWFFFFCNNDKESKNKRYIIIQEIYSIAAVSNPSVRKLIFFFIIMQYSLTVLFVVKEVIWFRKH